jgi:hypothetical protein
VNKTGKLFVQGDFIQLLEKIFAGNLAIVYKWIRRDFLHERRQVSVTLYSSQLFGRM